MPPLRARLPGTAGHLGVAGWVIACGSFCRSEAEQVAEAAEASGLVVMEAMHYRYHPLIGRLRDLAGRYGFTGFSFALGDPDDLKCLAEDVIPELAR